MNDADSKKLEESKELRKRFVIGWAVDAQMLSTWDWLISKVKEQEGEIAELREINAGDIRTYQQLQSDWKTQQDKSETELASFKNDCTATHDRDSSDIKDLETKIEGAEARVKAERCLIRRLKILIKYKARMYHSKP